MKMAIVGLLGSSVCQRDISGNVASGIIALLLIIDKQAVTGDIAGDQSLLHACVVEDYNNSTHYMCSCII